jgi:hypothetical protein
MKKYKLKYTESEIIRKSLVRFSNQGLCIFFHLMV